MKKEWQKPNLEVLDVKMTFDGGSASGHRGSWLCTKEKSPYTNLTYKGFLKKWSDEVGSDIETNGVPRVWVYNRKWDEAAGINSN